MTFLKGWPVHVRASVGRKTRPYVLVDANGHQATVRDPLTHGLHTYYQTTLQRLCGDCQADADTRTQIKPFCVECERATRNLPIGRFLSNGGGER